MCFNNMAIVVRASGNEPIDVLIRKFNKKVQNDGLLTELKKREFYQKPALLRKMKKAAIKRRRYLTRRGF